MHGRKEWQLWPPAEASYAQQHVALALEQGGRGEVELGVLTLTLTLALTPTPALNLNLPYP